MFGVFADRFAFQNQAHIIESLNFHNSKFVLLKYDINLASMNFNVQNAIVGDSDLNDRSNYS